MSTFKMVYWKEPDFWLGYIEEYPDYQTQGETLDELKENVIDIYHEIQSGMLPGVKKVRIMELTVRSAKSF